MLRHRLLNLTLNMFVFGRPSKTQPKRRLGKQSSQKRLLRHDQTART